MPSSFYDRFTTELAQMFRAVLQELMTDARIFSVWCSQRDIVNAIELAVDADDSIRYEIFFVNSDNKWSYRDLSHAREVLGFSPRDCAEEYRG